MAQINDLEAYLADPTDFDAGLVLYVRFGTNQTLKMILQRSGATTYNHQKLNEALQELGEARLPCGKHKPSIKTPGVATPGAGSKGAAGSDRRPRLSSHPYAVPANHPELIRRYRQRAMLKSQLTLLPTQAERREQAFAILDLTDEIETILFKGFTSSKPKNDDLPEDRADLAKRLTTNRKYISKFRNRDDKRDEINRRAQENEQIEQLLLGAAPRVRSTVAGTPVDADPADSAPGSPS